MFKRKKIQWLYTCACNNQIIQSQGQSSPLKVIIMSFIKTPSGPSNLCWKRTGFSLLPVYILLREIHFFVFCDILITFKHIWEPPTQSFTQRTFVVFWPILDPVVPYSFLNSISISHGHSGKRLMLPRWCSSE